MTDLTATRGWSLTVGPESRTHKIRDGSSPFDLLATDLRVTVPFDLSLEQFTTVLETVWIALALDNRPMLKVPLSYLPGGGGPATLFVSVGPYFGTAPLMVWKHSIVSVTAAYDPDSWSCDPEAPRPRPVPLAAPVTLYVALYGTDDPAAIRRATGSSQPKRIERWGTDR